MINSFKKVTLSLSCLSAMPIVLTSVALLLAFTYIHGQKTAAFDKQIGDIARTFFREPRAGYLEKPHIFERHSKQLLKLGYFVSFALLDEQKKIVKSLGLPIKQKITAPYLTDARNNDPDYHQISWVTKSRRYMLLPMGERFASETDEKDDEAKASILVVIDKNHQALTHFQWFFVVTVLLLLSLCLAYFYYHLIHKQVVNPLNSLRYTINNSSDAYSIKNLDFPENHLLHNLQGSIQQLVSRQKKMHETLHTQIKTATDELRESLDSLEIKNIELNIARKQALEKNQLKSEFLANTSHELRTPLNGIIGFTDLLTKTNLSDEQKEYLSTIDDSSKNLLNIINDILDFSRLDNGTLHLEHKPFNTNTTIEQTLNLQAVRANEKNIKLIYIPDINLPETLVGDAHRLQQVLSQLLSNAIKFSHSGKVILYAQNQESNADKVRLKFIIKDEGIGLDEEEKEKLFQSFTQLDRGDNRSYSGTGLGLSIANGLVGKMSGELGVDSQKGKGSSFWFTATMNRENNNRNSSLFVSSLKSVHILIYDTDDLGRIELNNKLNTWGATIHDVKLFSQIPQKAHEILANARKFSRFHPAAILDAQTSQNSLDKLALKKVVTTLSKELMIPTVVICPPGKQALINPLLKDLNTAVISRPLQSETLYRSLYNQIGIFNSNATLKPAINTQRAQEHAIRVLAVDDNLANLKLVKELLKELNTIVTIVQSGEEALTHIKNERFDLILMDIQMPNMDGYETTQNIRKLENNKYRTPIVALTAHATGDDKIRILLSGMDDFLSKPVGSQDMNHIIDRWVIKENTYQTPSTHNVEANKDSLKPPKEKKNLATQSHSKVNKPNAAPVNISQSLELAKDNAHLAHDMLSMLIESLPDEVMLMQEYIDNSKFEKLQEIVHKIHGGACYCGVPRLLKISSTLDANLKNNRTDKLDGEYAELLAAIRELVQWSKDHDLAVLFNV